MLPLLRLAAGGEIRVPDATERLADAFGLTAAEREQLLPSGRQRVLDKGRKLPAQKPTRIDVKRLQSIPSFAEFYRRDASATLEALRETSTPASPAADTTPEEQIETAFAALGTALREDLIARILQNTPGVFEGVIIDLPVVLS
jgi:restriction system protein